MSDSGTLYVVATPIGNLEDITHRAVRVFSEVDLIAAEDTRRTKKLLSHLGIQKPMISYYEPKEEKSIPKILSVLGEGKDVALVTDGGTPAISDPGYRLVKAAIEEDLTVVPIPGPSALAAALSVSGIPTDRVTFAGFLPNKSSARKKELLGLKDRADSLVFYESPNRILKLLNDAVETLGDRQAVLFREITKIYEERIDGNLSDIIGKLEGRTVKGEITLIIHGNRENKKLDDEEINALISISIKEKKLSIKEISKNIAEKSGRPKKEIYSMVLQARDSE